MREDGRQQYSLRNITITPHTMPYAEGSAKIQLGKTEILCSASVEETTPKWRMGQGWITAEYNMLPRATSSRTKREKMLFSGRTKEISRLISRSLRAGCNLKMLGERQIHIDCDVIQADGGTRTASITGGFVALALALKKLLTEKSIEKNPLLFYVSAVSIAILNESVIVDPSSLEDQECSTDMNIVLSHHGNFIEIQGTAEKNTFTSSQLQEMIIHAQKACENLFQAQAQIIGDFFQVKTK